MKILLVSLGYLKWHYGQALQSFTKIWKNFLFFIYSFFSLTALFKNFFDPWKKMADTYPAHFDFQKFFFTILTNLIVRLVGMIMRAALIIIGLACLLLLVIFYPAALIIWLLLPLIIIILIITGLLLIIK